MLAACGKPAQVTLYEERQGGQSSKRSFQAIPRSGTHMVRPTDSLYKIAQQYGLSTRALIDRNGLKPPYRLFVGQRLHLPRPKRHKIVAGDTVYGISRKYGVAMSQLVRLNDLKPPYKIVVGRSLRLPGAIQTARSVPRSRARSSERARKQSTSRSNANRRKTNDSTARNSTRAPKIPVTKGGFVWPLQGRVISRFGAKGKGLHNDGINLAAARGTPVYAAQSGVVAYAGNELRGFGNLVLIRHSNGIMSAYAHNDSLLVKSGETVRRGQRIAKVGSTGSVDEPQLHFEIRSGRDAIDPIKFLRKNAAQISHGIASDRYLRALPKLPASS